jgi:sterol 3beta-glucosyltransferase
MVAGATFGRDTGILDLGVLRGQFWPGRVRKLDRPRQRAFFASSQRYPMRIGLQTWGSEGDIRPFVALADGLKKAGHEVTLVITSVENKDYTSLAHSLGLRIRQVRFLSYNRERFGQEVSRARQSVNPFKQVSIVFSHLFDPVAQNMYVASEQLCRDNDVVIGYYLLYPLAIAAGKTKRPRVAIFISPNFLRSRYAPPEGLPKLGERLNTLLWNLAEVLMDRVLRPGANLLRIQEGLQPVSCIVRELVESNYLNLIPVSPTLCPPQPDWKGRYHLCGFFNLPETRENWQMPDDLKAFLKAGDPPVFMTFGSTATHDPSLCETTRLMIEAVSLGKFRAIIQSRWEDLNEISGSSRIYRIGYAPHQQIFPHCAAVVHHGGAGTTQSATRCGCPSVVVEHALDQRLWGILLNRAGLAPKPLHRRSLTPAKLAKAVRNVLGSMEMATRAKAAGRAMLAENGVRRAVELIEERFVSK